MSQEEECAELADVHSVVCRLCLAVGLHDKINSFFKT